MTQGKRSHIVNSVETDISAGRKCVPAWNKTCNKCGGKNNLSLKCTQPFMRNRPAVNTVFSVDSDSARWRIDGNVLGRAY